MCRNLVFYCLLKVKDHPIRDPESNRRKNIIIIPIAIEMRSWATK